MIARTKMIREGKKAPSFRKPQTVDELVTAIYEDNLSHFEFHENMGGDDCDCAQHITLNTIATFMGWDTEN